MSNETQQFMSDEMLTKYLDTSTRPTNFKEFILWCNKKYEEIPFKHRGDANVFVFDDDGNAMFEISYKMPITWEDKEARRHFEVTNATNTIKYLKLQYPELANL